MSRLNGLVFDSRVQASLITMCLIIFLVFVGSAIAQPGGAQQGNSGYGYGGGGGGGPAPPVVTPGPTPTPMPTPTPTPTPDITPPAILDVYVWDISCTCVDIYWETDDPGDSQVEYRTADDSPVLSNLYPDLVTSHRVTICDLTPQTTYYYKVMSRDAADNLATSADYSFTTPPCVVPPPFPWWGWLLIVIGALALGVLGWYLWQGRRP